MAEIKLSVYKTPSQAERIGKTIQITTTITASEASTIKSFYDKLDLSVTTLSGVVTDILVDVIERNGFKAFGHVVDILNIDVKSYFKKLADKFDMFTTRNASKCKITYKYKQSGSNDGAYWITDIKLI